jgi:hypothetical protein
MKIARYQSAAGTERLGIVTSLSGRELLVDVAKAAAARGGPCTPESVMGLIEGGAPASCSCGPRIVKIPLGWMPLTTCSGSPRSRPGP